MPVAVETVDVLKKYFRGVITRANHHAPNIDTIVYALLGIVILKMDDDTDIEVRGSNEDHTGNILWVTIKGIRYTFRYEHADGSIEVRRNSSTGPLVIKISNATPINNILTAF